MIVHHIKKNPHDRDIIGDPAAHFFFGPARK
jgi:hypothetical protein